MTRAPARQPPRCDRDTPHRSADHENDDSTHHLLLSPTTGSKRPRSRRLQPTPVTRPSPTSRSTHLSQHHAPQPPPASSPASTHDAPGPVAHARASPASSAACFSWKLLPFSLGGRSPSSVLLISLGSMVVPRPRRSRRSRTIYA